MTTPTTRHQHSPESAGTARTVRLLSGVYFGLTLLTIGVIAVLHSNAAAVTPAVWSRGAGVAVAALVTLLCAHYVAAGSRRAYVRLRIITALQVVAIAIIVAIPGAFPAWMRIDQVVVGLVLLAAVILMNGRSMRLTFAR